MSDMDEQTEEVVIDYPTANLKDTLRSLKIKLDQVLEFKKSPDNQESITRCYKEEIRPLLLATRHYNRVNKKRLLAMADGVRKVDLELTMLQSVYDSLYYKACCLDADARQKRCETNVTNIETIDSLENHNEKMQALDKEEIRRRELHLRLSKLEEETKQLEVSCSKGEKQLKEVKPYVKQLVEKANTTLNLDELQ